MNYLKTKTYTEQLKIQCQWLIIAVGGLFAIAIIQLLGLIYVGNLAHQARIIERPLGLNAPFWISKNSVSATYLAGFSRFIVQLYLNVSPATVALQHQLLLQNVAPENYDAVKRILLSMQQQIHANDETCVFLAGAPEVNAKTLEAKIRGTLMVSDGNAHTIKTQKTFLLQFKLQNGQLLLAQFSEEKP